MGGWIGILMVGSKVTAIIRISLGIILRQIAREIFPTSIMETKVIKAIRTHLMQMIPYLKTLTSNPT